MVWFAHKQFCGPNSKPFSFPPLTKEEAADLRFLLLSSSPEVFDPSVNMVMRLTTRAFGRLPQEMLTRRNLERSADGAALLRKFSTTHTDTDPVVSVSRVLVLASTEIHSQSEGASSSFPPLDEDWSVALLHHVVIFSAILEQILKTEGDSAVQRLDTGPLDPLLAAAVQPMASAILARAAHSASQARILEGAVLDVVESAGDTPPSPLVWLGCRLSQIAVGVMNGVELSVIGSPATGRRGDDEEPLGDAASSRLLGIDPTRLDCAGGDLGTASLAHDRPTEPDSSYNLPPLDPLDLAPYALAADRQRSSRTGWWLDVTLPSVDDMRDLRKIVPLHPLTIEDILHQETREKVESFTTLGYYFVVFRALGESRSKSGFVAEKVHAVNLYLVVFRDGVLSFHFDPLDQHLTRVRGRLNKLGNSRTFSSDWIAYSLMDSVVDAFFPLVTHIEREATKVDAQLSDPFSTIASRVSRPFALAHRFAAGLATFFSAQLVKTNLAASTLSGDLIGSTRSSRISYLRRLTSLRQLVAGSTRLLAPKVDVVRNLRKRAVDGSPVFRSSSEHEFVFHLEDLLDHIVAMQQTLQFFDAILAHDHPAYIGLLRLSLKLTKTEIDQGIVRLTAVAVVFLPLQLFTTFMGINVRLPYDDDHGPYPGPRLAPFAVCIAILAGIAGLTGLVIHLVVLSSRRKYRRRRRANE
ncbi:hypothetical protein JCM8097_000070 [Rhodosporidiobolus ruineniae]